MIYVYCPRVSEGASSLTDELNDLNCPARFTRGRLLRERFRPDRDRLVCWGAHWPGLAGLNNVAPVTKLEEVLLLRAGGVPTVQAVTAIPGFAVREATWGREEARAVMHDLQVFLDAEWLPRRNNHLGGSDLLRPGRADYYSLRESLENEYRIHCFHGRSIRAGMKVPREGMVVHEWIRSFDAGWRIQYDGFSSRRDMREIASAAVMALDLDFGAVDLGERRDGSLLVLEVNRAPGIEGNSVLSYAEHIKEAYEVRE